MMTAGEELDTAGMDFARTAARALQAAQALVEMHARGSERRQRRAEHAAREEEHTRERAARDDELAERRAERAQRMAEREQRMSERAQKMTTRAARRDGSGHDRRPDPGTARDAMAARWAAADAVRRLDPDAAAAWDAAMREAGVDPDSVCRLADAAMTARTATTHPGTIVDGPAPPPAAAAEQLAMDFVTDALDQHPTPAGGPDRDTCPAADSEPDLGGGGIGEAIATATNGTGTAVDTPAAGHPGVPDGPGLDVGAGPTAASGTDPEAGR